MRILAAAVLIAVASAGFAQKPPAKPPVKPAAKPAVKTEVKCPVMPAMKVKIATATKNKMFTDYKGRRYFFCCPVCPGMFKKDPDKYAKTAESIPTPPAK